MNQFLSPQIKTIRDLRLTGRTVFMRVDFNVPLSAHPKASLSTEGSDTSGTSPEESVEWQIDDDTRIQESLPTLRYAIERGAKIVLASHLGRPSSKRSPEFSLEPVAHRLAALLGQEVTLADDCVGDGIELMVKGMKNGQVLLLENLRYHKEEEANDPEFSRRLARLGEVYISDAFGTAHRKHASTYGVPSLILEKGIGLLIEKELRFLDPLLHQAKRPFYAVLGGSKVTSKIKTIEELVRRVDGLVIGGAMAHAFWAVQGDTLPPQAKHPHPDDVEAARSIMRDARRREIELLVPSDTHDGFDIGPKTIQKFSQKLADAGTIFWNGPMGMFEKPEYAEGTLAIARAIANTQAIKIVGGGDTISAVKKTGLSEKFDHLSTGGGAVLEYLEGKGLPGIDVLRLSNRQLIQIGQKPLEE